MFGRAYISNLGIGNIHERQWFLSTTSAPPPPPKPTVQALVPELDDELHRMIDGKFECIVTKDRVLVFNNYAPIKRIFLSDITEVGVDWQRSGSFEREYAVWLDLRSTLVRQWIGCPNEGEASKLAGHIKIAMMFG